MARYKLQVPQGLLYRLADRGLMRHRIEEALKTRVLRQNGSLAEVIWLAVDHEQESAPQEPRSSSAGADRPIR